VSQSSRAAELIVDRTDAEHRAALTQSALRWIPPHLTPHAAVSNAPQLVLPASGCLSPTEARTVRLGSCLYAFGYHWPSRRCPFRDALAAATDSGSSSTIIEVYGEPFAVEWPDGPIETREAA